MLGFVHGVVLCELFVFKPARLLVKFTQVSQIERCEATSTHARIAASSWLVETRSGNVLSTTRNPWNIHLCAIVDWSVSFVKTEHWPIHWAVSTRSIHRVVTLIDYSCGHISILTCVLLFLLFFVLVWDDLFSSNNDLSKFDKLFISVKHFYVSLLERNVDWNFPLLLQWKIKYRHYQECLLDLSHLFVQQVPLI